MISTRSRLAQAVALILAVSLSQICVRTLAAQQALGRLYTSGDRDIRVDKAKASTGMTILDGAQLQTPDGKLVTATQLDATDRKRAEVCYPDGSRSDFSPTCKAAGGVPLPWIVGLGLGSLGGVLALVAVSGSGAAGENPSDTAPF